MNNIGEQVNQVLNNLAEKFGVTVDRLYPILRKQAQVELINSTIRFVIGLIMIYAAYKIWDKANKRTKAEIKEIKEKNGVNSYIYKDSVYNFVNDDFGKAIFMLIVLLIGFLIVVIDGNSIIQISINPDFYIAQMIMDMIKNIK